MNFYFNGIEIQDGEKHYFNDAHIKDIYLKRKIDSDYLHVYQYDNTEPTLLLNSPTAQSTVSASARTFTIQGSVSDNDSGVNSVTINDVPVALTNGTFTYTTNNDTRDYIVKVTDNAGNISQQTIHIVRQKYNSISTGDTRTPGNVGYHDWCVCNICGERGQSAEKWKDNGNQIHPDDTSSMFTDCPKGPHYMYTISIT